MASVKLLVVELVDAFPEGGGDRVGGGVGGGHLGEWGVGSGEWGVGSGEWGERGRGKGERGKVLWEGGGGQGWIRRIFRKAFEWS